MNFVVRVRDLSTPEEIRKAPAPLIQEAGMADMMEAILERKSEEKAGIRVSKRILEKSWSDSSPDGGSLKESRETGS